MTSLLQPEERVLSTLNADGTRRWLDPKPVKGFFRSRRKAVGWFLIVVFMVLPHLHLDGEQLFFLNIAGGEFTLFGVTFLRTDTLLLALAAISLFVSVFLLTAIFGRVWCGWACPQTVYLEFLFRPLGKLFDGKGRSGLRGAISKLPPKARATLRWALVFLICFHLCNTFLAYFVGSRTVFEWSLQPPWEHPAGFGFVMLVTGLMVADFGFFREQLCFIACPYGRFQSVMLDRHSLIVGYDARRGEPRGKPRRGRAKRGPARPDDAPTDPRHAGGRSVALPVLQQASAAASNAAASSPASPPVTPAAFIAEHHPGGSANGTVAPHADTRAAVAEAEAEARPVHQPEAELGDCVDCHRCVAVCPTGIDIRDGLQLECIHCARCIDACDEVMSKLGRQPGLIRYSSQAGLEGERGRFVRPRVIIYPLILVAVLSALVLLTAGKAPAELRLIRDKGQPFYVLPDREISNQVRLRITNRSERDRTFSVASPLEGVRAQLQTEDNTIAAGETASLRVLLIARTAAFAGSDGSLRVPVRVADDAGFEATRSFTMLGPMNVEAEPAPPDAARSAEEPAR